MVYFSQDSTINSFQSNFLFFITCIYYLIFKPKCWSNKAEKRSTFDKIMYNLENDDEQFITEGVDENELFNNKFLRTFHKPSYKNF